LGYTTFGYAAYIFFSWFFIYLNTVRGLDLKATAVYAMLPFIAMAIGSPLGGWIGDRLSQRMGRRRGRATVALGGLALATVFIALGIGVESARLASVVLAGGAGALYISLSSFWATSADIGGSSAGAVSGVMNMGNQLAGALTSYLTPVIANRFGWSASFLVAAGLLVVGAVAWLVVNPEESLTPAASPLSPLPHGRGER
jgi:ACS family glucarate transporter-like MFS transporter